MAPLKLEAMEKKRTKKRKWDVAPDEQKIQYQIGNTVGEFSHILECWDHQTFKIVVIKVVRSLHKQRANVEIEVLECLAKNGRGGSRCVKILDSFNYGNHLCIVFEKLGPSLFEFLQGDKYCPFLVNLVQEIGRQILESVAYVHELGLIHTYLEPKNIRFVYSEYLKIPDYKWDSQTEMYFRCLPKSSAIIKLIGFGNTARENQDHSYSITTRNYRAPEVILGLEWNYPSDLWSVGCILGEALFQKNEDLEHLAMMERVLGPLPERMIQNSNVRQDLQGTCLNWPEGAVSENLVFQNAKYFYKDLNDLLHGLLEFDPSERLTARQALKHPFFKNPT
ncbi:hypothetical protein HHK36_021587 [Tetracentron sinense]|uniref:Protein kinase domain-containing protein n=1 Tax=Tetracentron sinense TaxID=13715 RepID=A0A834YQ13_TETSI|nr:hypothetical protein HHK36_021587 [Tetracentron sinense]